jgi:hypothetical protein
LVAPDRYFKKGRIKADFEFDIAFYSSGLWMRKLNNDKLPDNNSLENENWLINALFEYCKKQEKTLRIFAHPIEKRIPNRKLTLQHYGKYLQHDWVSIQNFEENSNAEFDKVNLGIALFSQLMFERIYLGYKTILTPIEDKKFPIPGSNIALICLASKLQLDQLLDQNIDKSTDDYFKDNEISYLTPFLN